MSKVQGNSGILPPYHASVGKAVVPVQMTSAAHPSTASRSSGPGLVVSAAKTSTELSRPSKKPAARSGFESASARKFSLMSMTLF